MQKYRPGHIPMTIHVPEARPARKHLYRFLCVTFFQSPATPAQLNAIPLSMKGA